MSFPNIRLRVLFTAGMMALAMLPTLCTEAQLQSRRNRGQASDLPINFGFDGPRISTRGFVPRHELRVNRAEMQPTRQASPRSSVPGRLVGFQDPQAEAEGDYMDVAPAAVEPGADFFGSCSSCGTDVGCGTDWTDTCNDCAGACGGCGSYGTCGPGGCLLPCPQLSFRSMEFFGGVQGFKGQPNLGQEGSFGFNVGFNWGFRLPCLHSDLLTGQFGIRSVNSNFQEGPLTLFNRDQLFVTTGLVRRVDYGLQGGVVADILHETWYAETTIAQLRGGLSWVYEGGSEFGFNFTTSIQNDTEPALIAGVGQILTSEALNQYRFFYGYPLDPCCDGGANVTWFLGGSANSDTILGSDFWFPVANNWGLSTGFMYMIPDNTAGLAGNVNEAWNIGINLIWYPMGHRAYQQRYMRPLYNVADNGTFLTDR